MSVPKWNIALDGRLVSGPTSRLFGLVADLPVCPSSREAKVFLRAIALLVMMSGLLFLYRIHPVAGWATLSVMFAGSLIARHRRGASPSESECPESPA